MEDVRDMLEEAIRSDIENMNELEIGSEQRSRHAEDLARLYSVYNDEYQTRYDSIQKEMALDLEREKIEKELELKKESVEAEKKQGKFKNIVTGATAAAGVALTLLGFKLEKDGCILPDGTTDRLSKLVRFVK